MRLRGPELRIYPLEPVVESLGWISGFILIVFWVIILVYSVLHISISPSGSSRAAYLNNSTVAFAKI